MRSYNLTHALFKGYVSCYSINIRINPIKGQGTLHFTELYMQISTVQQTRMMFLKHIILPDKVIRSSATNLHHTRFQDFNFSFVARV